MNRAQSVELGVWMNAWATSQQTGLLRGIGGQLKKLESAQHEATAAQQRLADAPSTFLAVSTTLPVSYCAAPCVARAAEDMAAGS